MHVSRKAIVRAVSGRRCDDWSRSATRVRCVEPFRLGARPGDLAAAAADPRDFLKQEAASAAAALVAPDLPPSNIALQQMFADQERIRQERERTAKIASATPPNGMIAGDSNPSAMANAMTPSPVPAGAPPPAIPKRRRLPWSSSCSAPRRWRASRSRPARGAL